MALRIENSYANFYETSLNRAEYYEKDSLIFNIGDRTEKDKKAKTKAARNRALAEGSLKIIPEKIEKRWLLKDKVTPAKYEYTCNGRESLGQIKAKFGIKDKALQKHLSWLRDDEHIPPKDYKIYFNVTDVE